MDDDRLNSPSTSAVMLEVLGHKLHFSQDPNSKHLGTTVWDASIVFIKFLEKNCRKGKFSPSKLKGKRVIELGAGCGLAGFGMALLGCDVVSTDQIEVLPLLMKNAERNTSWVMQANPDSASFGSIEVAELDWGNKDHIEAVGPPFDFIIGTDIVYAEHLLEPLLHTTLALSGPRTTVMLGYEIRSTTVHEQMISMWKNNFEVKAISRAKMDSKYQHPSIQLYIMQLKPQLRCEGNLSNALQIPEHDNGSDEDDGSTEAEEREHIGNTKLTGGEPDEPENGKMDEWDTRRYPDKPTAGLLMLRVSEKMQGKKDKKEEG